MTKKKAGSSLPNRLTNCLGLPFVLPQTKNLEYNLAAGVWSSGECGTLPGSFVETDLQPVPVAVPRRGTRSPEGAWECCGSRNTISAHHLYTLPEPCIL